MNRLCRDTGITIMRVFFGIEPGSETRQSIADWRDRYGLAAGKPVPPANFHVTLAFIGDVNDRDLETLCHTVDEQQRGQAFVAGALTLDRVGYWPGPAIYWMGTSQDVPQISQLAHKLQSLSGRVGGRSTKKAFTPHITLYRNCGAPPPAPVVLPDIELTYTQITLFESKPGRTGVSYHPLAEWDLGQALGLT